MRKTKTITIKDGGIHWFMTLPTPVKRKHTRIRTEQPLMTSSIMFLDMSTIGEPSQATIDYCNKKRKEIGLPPEVVTPEGNNFHGVPWRILKGIKKLDRVLHGLEERDIDFHKVMSIRHDFHYHRKSDNIYCQVNGYFWYYNDIKAVKVWTAEGTYILYGGGKNDNA